MGQFSKEGLRLEEGLRGRTTYREGGGVVDPGKTCGVRKVEISVN